MTATASTPAPRSRAATASSSAAPGVSSTLAVGAHPGAHLEDPVAWNEGRLARGGEVVRAREAEPGELEHVAVALRHDEGHARPPALDDRVEADGGAVHHELDVAQGHAEGLPTRARIPRSTAADGSAGTLGSLWNLRSVCGHVHQHEVGERPADVDADPVARHRPGSFSEGTREGRWPRPEPAAAGCLDPSLSPWSPSGPPASCPAGSPRPRWASSRTPGPGGGAARRARPP